MPERHEKFKRMLDVRVRRLEFPSDRLVTPAALQQCQQFPLCFFSVVDGHVGRSPCYRSRRVKARSPCVAGLTEMPQQEKRRLCPSFWAVSRSEHGSSYSGGGLRLCSFRSSRPFQYLKLLSKCCIRLGRSAKAEEKRRDIKQRKACCKKKKKIQIA